MVNYPTPLAQPRRSRLQPLADAIAPGSVVRDEAQFVQYVLERSQQVAQQNGDTPENVLGRLLSAAEQGVRNAVTPSGIAGSLRNAGQGLNTAINAVSDPTGAFQDTTSLTQLVTPQDRPVRDPSRSLIYHGISEEELQRRSLLQKLATPVLNLPQDDARRAIPGDNPLSRLVENVVTEAAAQTSPIGATSTIATAGALPAAAPVLGRVPVAGRALAGAAQSAGLLSEAGINVGAGAASRSAGQELPANTPQPLRTGVETLAGLAGGVAGAGAPAIGRGVARNLDTASIRSGLDRVSPIGTASAKGLSPDDALEAEVSAYKARVATTAQDLPTPSPRKTPVDQSDEILNRTATGGTPKPADGPPQYIGSVLPDGSVVTPKVDGQLFGIRTPDLGITRAQSVVNRVRNILPDSVQSNQFLRGPLRTDADPLVDNMFKVRGDIINASESRAVAVSGRLGPEYRKVFQPDQTGRIASLTGVVPEIPGAPTIQDVAARLPAYREFLTPPQRNLLEDIRKQIEPVTQALRDSGDEFGQRTDIMEGGFYLPRGSASTGDNPTALRIGGTRGRPSFERSALFSSHAEGIAKGYEYPRFEESLDGLIRRSGTRIADRFTANYLSTVRDVDGTKFGKTAKELLLEKNPKVAAKMDALRAARDRLSSLAGNKAEQQLRALDQFIHDPTFTDLDGVRALFSKVRVRGGGLDKTPVENRAVLGLREVSTDVRKARKTAARSQTVSRGQFKGLDVFEVRDAIRDVQTAINEFKPVYDQALQSAVGREGKIVEIPQLNGTFFPERMAARANQLLAKERQQFPDALETVNAIQSIFKGAQATADASFTAIQGLMSAYSNPRAYQRAMRASARAFKTPEAYADAAKEFNKNAARRGTLSLEQWTDFGLAQLSGVDTDVSARLIERVPVIGRVARGSDRAFATAGNILRPQYADDLLMEEMAKGKTLQQIVDDGTARRIAEFANAATGYVDGKFSVSNLITFSQRFLTARITTLARAVRGLDARAPVDAVPVIGPRIARKIPKLNPAARLEDQLATRAVIRMFGFATLATTMINDAQGQDTDFRPFVGGKPNPNFIRFRWGNRDWSLLGPWDSTLRLLGNLGTGNFKSAARSYANAPVVSLGWDLIENKDYFGRPIIRPEKDSFGNPIKVNGRPVQVTNWDRTQDITARVAQMMVPFATSDAPDIIAEIAKGASDGHLNEVGVNIALGFANGVGAKSSQLSNDEIKELLEDPDLAPRFRQELEQELKDRSAAYKTGYAQRLFGQSPRSRGSSTPARGGSLQPARTR